LRATSWSIKRIDLPTPVRMRGSLTGEMPPAGVDLVAEAVEVGSSELVEDGTHAITVDPLGSRI
jgi:hypothetical protein